MASQNKNGFTIVELLIVIVVIGILAAITIVAYNGVQSRARAATATNAVSDAAKKVEVFAADGAGYPATLAAAGVVDGNSTYQYTVNNAVTPATYCLTATYATASYMMSSGNNVPTAGACPGHGVGGVAPITNYVLNPSAEVSAAGIATDSGSPTIARSTAFANQGTASFILTDTIVSTDIAGRLNVNLNPGTYTFAYSVYSPDARQGGFDWFDNTAAVGANGVGTIAIPANTWTRVRSTVTFGGSGVQNVAFYMHNRNGPNASGASLYIDGLMVTDGATTYNYADGATANWVWNGTAHNATSTGPPV